MSSADLTEPRAPSATSLLEEEMIYEEKKREAIQSRRLEAQTLREEYTSLLKEWFKREYALRNRILLDEEEYDESLDTTDPDWIQFQTDHSLQPYILQHEESVVNSRKRKMESSSLVDFIGDAIISKQENNPSSMTKEQSIKQILFPKKPSSFEKKKAANDPFKGYKLYAAQAKTNVRPLAALTSQARKAVFTSDWQLVREEIRLNKMVQRMDQLKAEGVWSFRQLKPHVPPSRPRTHWDYLLDEVKWMSTDFIQERKWKKAVALTLANAVLQWHQTSPQLRATLCVKRTRDGRPLNKRQKCVRLTQEPGNVSQPKTTSTSTTPTDQIPSTAEDQSAFISDLMALDKENQDPHVSSSPTSILLDPHLNLFFCDKDPDAAVSRILAGWNTYTPPVHDDSILLKETGSIVPVSWLMVDWPTVPTAESNLPDTLKWLPLDGMYKQTSKNTGPFQGDIDSQTTLPKQSAQPIRPPQASTNAPSDPAATNPVDPHQPAAENADPPSPQKTVQPPSIPQPRSTKPCPQWTTDEDDALWNLCKLCNKNWFLISDSLQSMRVGTGHIRSQWECYERYTFLVSQGFESSAKSDYLYSTPVKSTKAILNDKKMKALKYLNNFELITKCAKRRDTQKQPSKANKNQVNLSAHDTHQDSQVQAGVDPSGPPLSPAELALMKERRDKQIQEQQRLAAAQGRPGLMFMNRMNMANGSLGAMGPFRPKMRPLLNNGALGANGALNVGPGGVPFARGPSGNALLVGAGTSNLAAQQSLLMSRLAASNPGLTTEQLQALVTRHLLAARAVAANNANNASLAGQGMNVRPSIQAANAAALVALQNAQNASKLNQLTPEMIQRQVDKSRQDQKLLQHAMQQQQNTVQQVSSSAASLQAQPTSDTERASSTASPPKAASKLSTAEPLRLGSGEDQTVLIRRRKANTEPEGKTAQPTPVVAATKVTTEEKPTDEKQSTLAVDANATEDSAMDSVLTPIQEEDSTQEQADLVKETEAADDDSRSTKDTDADDENAGVTSRTRSHGHARSPQPLVLKRRGRGGRLSRGGRKFATNPIEVTSEEDEHAETDGQDATEAHDSTHEEPEDVEMATGEDDSEDDDVIVPVRRGRGRGGRASASTRSKSSTRRKGR